MNRHRRKQKQVFLLRRILAGLVLLGIVAIIPALVGFKQEPEQQDKPPVASAVPVKPLAQGPSFPAIPMKDWSSPEPSLLNETDISVGAMIVVDTSAGTILAEKEAHARVFPASTTKLMTALLAYEKAKAAGELDAKKITVRASTLDIPWDSHIAHLEVGDTLTVRQALYATLLESGNDAANSLAEYTSGSTDAFVQLMNERAAFMGLSDTHFMNAHGYSDPNHYTTAHDMAKIAYAFQTYPELVTIAGTYEFKAEFTNQEGQAKRRWWYHLGSSVNNRSVNYSKHVVAMKTGYTDESGYTMVFMMRHENRHYVVVTMQAKSGQTFPTFRLIEERLF